MSDTTPKKAAPVARTATKPPPVDGDTATPAPTPETDTQRPVWEGGESRQDYHARVHAWKVSQRADRPISP